MTNEESIIRFPSVAGIPPIDRSGYNQLAVIRILDLRCDIVKEADAYNLQDEDLTPGELAERQQCVTDILTWLNGCTNDISVLQLSLQMISSRWSNAETKLRRLLKDANDRKVKIAEENAERQKAAAAKVETERRIKYAVAIINPPSDQITRILSTQEFKLFAESVNKALDAVLAAQDRGDKRPDAWKEDPRSYQYLRWLSMIDRARIEQIREKEAARQTEEAAFLAASQRTTAVDTLRAKLLQESKPTLPYPLIAPGYQVEDWDELVLPDCKQIEDWAAERIREQVPTILSNLIRWNLSWESVMLPQASYEATEGIPALRWSFIAQILVTANLELDHCQILEKTSQHSTLTEGDGQKLGKKCLRVDWSLEDEFSTPIILLRALAGEHMEVPGVTVIERKAPLTFFSVEGVYDVGIHDGFRTFIKKSSGKKPLWETLLGIGIIDATSAELLKKKWNQNPPASTANSSGEVTMEKVIDKLMELGWSETDAKKATCGVEIPIDATTESIVKLVIETNTDNH